ncbi:hypothetical protein PIB30_020145 [Stylosanthes scabra]|uniref:Uncharacterized protein n=1 Tax=Stylosanthes scabra TaxID=79078 RepID=A0ABU6Y910_9FABA|nr:hypothetical protein [Stylosanthes scabra]
MLPFLLTCDISLCLKLFKKTLQFEIIIPKTLCCIFSACRALITPKLSPSMIMSKKQHSYANLRAKKQAIASASSTLVVVGIFQIPAAIIIPSLLLITVPAPHPVSSVPVASKLILKLSGGGAIQKEGLRLPCGGVNSEACEDLSLVVQNSKKMEAA